MDHEPAIADLLVRLPATRAQAATDSGLQWRSLVRGLQGLERERMVEQVAAKVASQRWRFAAAEEEFQGPC